MNKVIYLEDVVKTIREHLRFNYGDEATEDLILSIGAALLNITMDDLNDMIHS